jgi:hypothetical protein
MKTLVILFGNLRYGELAWESLYRNLLDYNNYYYYSGTTPTTTKHQISPIIWTLLLPNGDPNATIYPNASLMCRANVIFAFPEYGDDWPDALSLIDPAWKEKIAPQSTNSSIPFAWNTQSSLAWVRCQPFPFVFGGFFVNYWSNTT